MATIVGFDDIPTASMTRLSLIPLAQPRKEMDELTVIIRR
jgi:DNA-binding LacI/PurR family transcriptional regulator